MIDFFFAAALIILVLVSFGWDHIKAFALAIYTWAMATFVHRVVVWSAPQPGANGALFTFHGFQIGNYFVGAVTNQTLTLVQPEPSKIVQP